MSRVRFRKSGKTEQYGFKVTMKAKLIAGFTLIVLLFTGAAVFHLQMQSEIERQISLQNGEIVKQQLAMQLKQEVQELAVIHAGIVVTRNDGKAGTYKEVEKSFMEHVKQTGETASTPEQRKWSATLNTVSGEFTATFHAALETLKATPADQAGRLLEQQFSLSQVHKDYIFEQIELFNDNYAQTAQAAMTKSDKLFEKVRAVSTYSVAAALLSAIVIAAWLTKSFLNPIRRMQQAMSLIGEGDLSHRIDSPSRDELGELGRSFDHMMDNVSGMLVRMRGIGTELNGKSTVFRGFSQSTAAANADILKAIGEIASGADQQAAFTEKSAYLVNELGREVSDIAHSADEMKRLGEQTDIHAKNGAETVSELRDAASRAD
ncbi:MAG: methyl-accepting chemotaxis sensory transducer, partial [Paenibacillus sp.]|nr:methyl-accepting chemotaxis sensory transducer [Paenibacillus sp.]